MARPEVTGRRPLEQNADDAVEERARAPPSPKLPHIERQAYRIVEFCAAHGMSRSKFYELLKLGLGPHVTDIDGVKIVTKEDAAVWRKQSSAASRKSAASSDTPGDAA
jgi:hypothetical protein